VALERDAFYVTALAHDLGLADLIVTMSAAPRADQCFTIRSADRALSMWRAGFPDHDDPEHRSVLCDAIVGHITPALRLRFDESPYAVYLQQGSLLDLVGMRSRLFETDWLIDVAERHPRGEIESLITRLWAAESDAVPAGRARVVNCLGLFGWAVRRWQYPSTEVAR
jgi:hypothetical protein